MVCTVQAKLRPAKVRPRTIVNGQWPLAKVRPIIIRDRTFKLKHQYFHINQINSKRYFCQGVNYCILFIRLITNKYQYFHILIK